MKNLTNLSKQIVDHIAHRYLSGKRVTFGELAPEVESLLSSYLKELVGKEEEKDKYISQHCPHCEYIGKPYLLSELHKKRRLEFECGRPEWHLEKWGLYCKGKWDVVVETKKLESINVIKDYTDEEIKARNQLRKDIIKKAGCIDEKT